MEFTVTADKSGFSGFVFIGFAHASDHSDSVVYDGFVGGVKDGEAYGASYVYQDGTLTRVPEERFQVIEQNESYINIQQFQQQNPDGTFKFTSVTNW